MKLFSQHINSAKYSTFEIVLLALLSAILIVSKEFIAFIPNVELVTLLIIIYTIYFRYKAFIPVLVFVLAEGILYGFNIYFISYMIAWPALVMIIMLLGYPKNFILVALISGIFGLLFDVFFAVPWFITGGLRATLVYLFNGILFSLVHGTANLIIALILFKPLNMLFKKLLKSYGFE